jgi:hypothetical protein
MRRVLLVALVGFAAATPAHAAARISPANRAAVNALLDRFVPAVVEGHDLRAGKQLVGGYVTVGTVQRYPAKPQNLHGWLLNYAQKDDVGFDLLLQPATKSLGPWSFRGEAKKVHGTWKIVDWYPVAEFQPVGKAARVDGPNDFSPAARGGLTGSSNHLWYLWIVPSAVGALLLGLLAWGVQHRLRQRSRVRAIERTLAGSR